MSDHPKFLGKNLSHLRCAWERVDCDLRGGWQIVMEEGVSCYLMCECCGNLLKDCKVNDDRYDTRYLVEACYESKQGNKRTSKRLYWACHDCLAMWEEGDDKPSAADKARADKRSSR
jgi:hypothetical protein